MNEGSPEWLPEFLLGASGAPVTERDEQRLARMVRREDFDGDLAAAEAVRHKVPLLVETSLTGLRERGHEVPEAFVLALARATREKRRTMAALWEECEALLKGLNGHGLEPLVLKGPAWATAYYPKPEDRGFGDIDLLIGADQLDDYGNALLSLGYSQSTYDPSEGTLRPLPEGRITGAIATGRHAAPFLRVDEESKTVFAVELHGPGFDPNFPHADNSCFLRRAGPWRLPSARARSLDPVDAAIYSAAHLWKDIYVASPEGKASSALLISFCDLRQMFLARPEATAWRTLYERADALRACDQVYFALVHLGRLYPEVVPESLLEPPRFLSRSPEAVLDDVWEFLDGASTFRERLFDPQVDERRFKRMQHAEEAGGRIEIPRGGGTSAGAGTGTGIDMGTGTGARIELSGASAAPAWQFFRTHVTYGVRPTSDEEFSAVLAFEHSEEHVRVCASVKDLTQVFDKVNGFYFAQDSVQLLFEYPLGSGRIKSYFLVPKAADLPGPAVVRHYAGFDRAGTELVAGSSATAEFSDAGYRVSAQLPKSELFPGLERGEWFGFDVVVYESGPPGQEKRSVLQWSGGRNAIRHPAYFGRARLQ
ncbi:nucleotidyltransferase family protein [Streptomyces sp. NPDC088400]|uniref:nucleotidyltransferase family protein n=1 Tax=Streptomyces sp. NPDC088400 TaxID=3365861 RepID=UPI0037F5973A